MDDEQVKREVWDGSVPVCFSIDDEEVSFNKSNLPEPCYVSSYLYIVLASC